MARLRSQELTKRQRREFIKGGKDLAIPFENRRREIIFTGCGSASQRFAIHNDSRR
jgi:hypothetical protein